MSEVEPTNDPETLEEMDTEELLDRAHALSLSLPPEPGREDLIQALEEYNRFLAAQHAEGMAQDRRNSAAAGRRDGRHEPNTDA